MKRLGLALAFCALLPLGGAQAQLAGGLMFPGPGIPAASGGGGFSLTFGSNAGTATTGTTIGYGTLTWGSGCNAVIVAVNWYNTNTTDTVSSMTVGGASASAIANTTPVSPGAFQVSSSIWQLNSPSGTSGTVSVTYSAATTFNSSAAVYCLVSTHTTVSSSASRGAGSGTNASATVTVPTGGGAVVTGATTSGGVITWTNATQDAVYAIGGTYEAVAHTTSTGSVTVTDTPASAQGNTVSVAAFGP